MNNIPYIDLDTHTIHPHAIHSISKRMAVEHYFFPFYLEEDQLHIAFGNPLTPKLLEELRFLTKKNIHPCYAKKEQISFFIEIYYGKEAVRKAVKELEQEHFLGEKEILSTKKAQEETAPVTRLLHALLGEAFQRGASDLHLEPFEEKVQVRVRIDGKLQEGMTLPKSIYAPLCTKIKVMANMNIAKKRTPQDGKINFSKEGAGYDLRVSSLPTVHGEKLVLRILYPSKSTLNLEELGFAFLEQQQLKALLHRPHGMILVTGPTGSGKSTTLYAMLQALNQGACNIVTLEDPVEYTMEGINQVSVNEQAGLTFPSGLRSILRQDPDIIMVGEIRDEQTAEMAVRAAITGHLVLSTMHTNDAVSSILRLENMGVPHYLLCDALTAVIAQRLIRKICPSCKEAYAPSEMERMQLSLERGKLLYKGKGCSKCSDTGYKGRTVVYEILSLSTEMKQRIVQGKSMEFLRAYAKHQGMTSWHTYGMELVKKGVTTYEEIHYALYIEPLSSSKEECI